MKQKVTTFYCKLDKRGIGSGMCCLVCKKRVRAKDPQPLQICEYEQVTGQYERDV